MRPTFAEINLSNLKFNFLNIKKKVRNTKIMAVVKADAYGHGMIECVNAMNSLKEKQPDYYSVALIEEALELRTVIVEQPILVFSPILESNVEEYFKHNILPTVFNENHIKILKKSCNGRKIKVHVKIDTGMGRLGIRFNEAVNFVENLSKQDDIIVDGIYMHFATSDERDKSFAQLQLKRFAEIVKELKHRKVNYGLAHTANSGAIIDLPDSYFDMVRPGISLYGYFPSLETSESIKLKPVMSLISFVSSIKEINKGESVSYGRKFIAKQKTKVATIPIGYADGYVRALTNKVEGIIGGEKYKQVGQVCMDRIMFNIGNGKVKEGNKIILLGKDKKAEVNAWDWSKILGTIPYEITCNISKRIPRVFID
ncbi:MAG: alanine racemase [Ignavibacteriales bacterium]|nr:alanine racemase [Ignavibacteriales bacterium]